MAAKLLKNSQIHFGFMPNAESLNKKIIQAYLNLGEEDFIRKSHFFNGRHENLYIERSRIPEIGVVLEQAESYAKEILGMQGQKIRSGFWFNDMGPGASTTEHNHDDNDELLSGVYYVQVPAESGELTIIDIYSRTIIRPQAGMFVFFAPDVSHSVSVNQSSDSRVSMGINFGPALL